MEPTFYMRSVVDRNVVMRRMNVLTDGIWVRSSTVGICDNGYRSQNLMSPLQNYRFMFLVRLICFNPLSAGAGHLNFGPLFM